MNGDAHVDVQAERCRQRVGFTAVAVPEWPSRQGWLQFALRAAPSKTGGRKAREGRPQRTYRSHCQSTERNPSLGGTSLRSVRVARTGPWIGRLDGTSGRTVVGAIAAVDVDVQRERNVA